MFLEDGSHKVLYLTHRYNTVDYQFSVYDVSLLGIKVGYYEIHRKKRRHFAIAESCK